MAQRKSARYFIERSNQDVKTELGWDEFQAISRRTPPALTIRPGWFITETRLDWSRRFARDLNYWSMKSKRCLHCRWLMYVPCSRSAAMPFAPIVAGGGYLFSC